MFDVKFNTFRMSQFVHSSFRVNLTQGKYVNKYYVENWLKNITLEHYYVILTLKNGGYELYAR